MPKRTGITTLALAMLALANIAVGAVIGQQINSHVKTFGIVANERRSVNHGIVIDLPGNGCMGVEYWNGRRNADAWLYLDRCES